LNRRHNAKSAIQAVKLCQEYGYKNISIDLIYGLPNQTLEIWQENIRQAIHLNIQHISAYHVIYEEGTKLFDLLENQEIQAIDEDLSVRMFKVLIDSLAKAGFRQYEISNFAQQGYESKHNSAYWKGAHYLGIGSSAHSYNGISRQWNSKSIEYSKFPPEIELIDENTAYNDFILTRMRTMEGINLDELETLFGAKKIAHFFFETKDHTLNQSLELIDNHIRFTQKGIFISDGIMSDLMLSSSNML
jgi:oxygen-independent coproporphyrinogen-3 oxidase